MLAATIRKPWNKYRLMHALAVSHWARHDAKQNPQVPAEEAYSALETRLAHSFDDRAAGLFAKREQALKSDRVAAIEHALGNNERALPALVRAVKGRIHAARIKANTGWVKVREVARQRYQELQDFKRENLLTREASYPPVIHAIGICTFAFVVETAVNATLFAEASQAGLAGGAQKAMTLSLPNIVLGLMAGFWGLRARHHVLPLLHHKGSIVTVLALTLAALWNFYVGHLRLLAEHLTHNRQQLRLSEWHDVRAQMLADPMAPFASSQAVALMLLGLIVVAIALWEGLDGFSDRYPGFARVDRRYRRAVRDVTAVKSSMFRSVARYTRRGIRDIHKLRRAAHRNTREALHILGRAAGVIIKFDSRILEEHSVHRQCLYEYQQLNRRHRDQVPARFASSQLPGTRATRPVYDWQRARTDIQSRAQQTNDAADHALAELERHRLIVMAEIENESSQLVRTPVLLPPPRLSLAAEPV
jgi:hypothetical protein